MVPLAEKQTKGSTILFLSLKTCMMRQRKSLLMQLCFGAGMRPQVIYFLIYVMDREEGDLSNYVRNYRGNGR